MLTNTVRFVPSLGTCAEKIQGFRVEDAFMYEF
jgi:hypothetical protein